MRKRIVCISPLALGSVLVLAVLTIASGTTLSAELQTLNTGQHFLPPYGNARDRFGFDSGALTGYDVAQLHAGWYSNWTANLHPAHPDGLVYVQLIRFHAGADPNDPAQVSVQPDKATIAQIAAAHPGSLWLMSNEPDSLYQGDPILPEVYAVVYHDFYSYIKGLDPAALIANGGIVQPTPCRLAYLDIVWDTYLQTYAEPWPVDVWNIHAFVLREVYGSWGASTPPGVDPSCGIDYAVDDAADVDLFWDNVRAMRTWMKEKGEQDKPLIISEYGILWPQWFAPQFTPQAVSRFMTQTFGLFLYGTDPEIGYPADEDRLVQAWAWYSLSDDQNYNGYLFHSDDKTLSPMGAAYGDYTAALDAVDYVDLSARLVAGGPGFTPTVTQTGGGGPLTFTVALSGQVGNLGKLPANDAPGRFRIDGTQDSAPVFSRDVHHAVPGRFEGPIPSSRLTATLTGPDRFQAAFVLDPEGQLDEPRAWNNVATQTLDLRPDLVASRLVYRLSGPAVQSGTLWVTATVGNQGAWPSTAVSATLYLRPLPEGTLGLPKSVTVPPLDAGAQVTLETDLDWPPPDRDLYHLTMLLDQADVLSERAERNNTARRTVPVPLSVTLSPTATTWLTSTGGALELLFPAGAVTTATQVVYTPIWPADWVTGVLKPTGVGFSLTARSDGHTGPLTFLRPVSLTWRYSSADVMGLEEGQIRLFRRAAGERWGVGACRPYRRERDQNRLTTGLCSAGLFVLGSRYDLHVPLIPGPGQTRHLRVPFPADPTPLRLPASGVLPRDP